MVLKKQRIVIIGAGMAGLSAANKLFKCGASKELFELLIVEGGTRIGGRINTSEFGGDRIEMGATWIHGIGGSPIHQIAQEINSLESEKPWECMDNLDEPVTIAEGGFKISPSIVEPINNLFNNLMDFAQGKSKSTENGISNNHQIDFSKISAKFLNAGEKGSSQSLSVGSFLRECLEAYFGSRKEEEEVSFQGNWNRKSLESAIFSMLENTQRTYTSAGDLNILDFSAEREYIMFPGEEITIAKGYLSIIESLASVLPAGTIQLGRKVSRIEWKNDVQTTSDIENGNGNNGYVSRPVKLHFVDGTSISADHVIVTVSLGVLKKGVCKDSSFFSPALPDCKIQAISRLGFGVVNKLFLQLNSKYDQEDNNTKKKFPFLQMVFHEQDSSIPWWMRRTASLSPIYSNSNVLLSWFAGEEALALETLSDEEILDGISETVSDLLPNPQFHCNGTVSSDQILNGEVKFGKVLKSKWGTDPLFLGSYSYVAVGSSGDDLDTMAMPLPKTSGLNQNDCPHQILFAGEATHRTHYSTTHGAYFSGIREANRLLQHYKCSIDM